ncbi:redox-regulated ATPase YchF [Candidatus Woesebacteria bacterium]|nr:redox-regulated ATPase YchF [Candidatus Woesebacteria bacterium]
MNLSVGIVGLPNVGKSTLFNALTRQEIPAENYPFCTIDPNTGIVAVPDDRLAKLAEIENSGRQVPAVVEFVDIAGLVKGASKGEGLGNKFLSHIREVDVIVHVLRFFSSEKITHVEESIDPARDREIIEMELMLKDIESVEKRLDRLTGEARATTKDSKEKQELAFWQDIRKQLEEGTLIKNWDRSKLTDDQRLWLKSVPLLSTKRVIYLANIGAGQDFDHDKACEMADLDPKKTDIIPMDVIQEADLIGLDSEELKEYTAELGIDDLGLNKLIKKSYEMLDLITFFTVGEMEARAWTITKGTLAPDAAATIHNDFKAKFIALDVIKYEDFIEVGGWQGAKEKGKIHLQGKEYVVEDGDVVLVKHNA